MAQPGTASIVRVVLKSEDDFAGWRDAARGLAEAAVPPESISWQVEGSGDLFGSAPGTDPPPPGPSFAVPRAFIELAKAAICHRDPERFALLYAMLLKLRGNREAMEDRADPLLHRIERMAMASTPATRADAPLTRKSEP